MSVTLHYIDEQLDLHDRTLCVKPMPNRSHTATLVLQQFDPSTIWIVLHRTSSTSWYQTLHQTAEDGCHVVTITSPLL